LVQLLLFPDADVPPRRPKKKQHKSRPCRLCGVSPPAPPKPRSVMPVGHAVETVRGILIDRLDGALGDLTRIAFEEACGLIEDQGTAESLAVRFVQRAQERLFPEEFGDGPEYTPDPSARMDVPPNPVGLVPRLPTMAIYARHLLEQGRQSPAASLSLPDGSPVFGDADLVRLAERQQRRANS
jgi:hypothetical protein